jgi:hypothetical protein
MRFKTTSTVHTIDGDVSISNEYLDGRQVLALTSLRRDNGERVTLNLSDSQARLLAASVKQHEQEIQQ